MRNTAQNNCDIIQRKKKMWLNFHQRYNLQRRRRSQIFVMAVKIKIIHIRISKIHKMSCIWNIQNTYQNSSKAYILRRLKRCEILLHWKPLTGTHVQYAWPCVWWECDAHWQDELRDVRRKNRKKQLQVNPHKNKKWTIKKSTESNHECTDPSTAGYKWFWCISFYLLEK